MTQMTETWVFSYTPACQERAGARTFVAWNRRCLERRGNQNVCFHSHDGVDSRKLLEHVQTATHQEGSSSRRVRQHAPDHRAFWKRTARQKNIYIFILVTR